MYTCRDILVESEVSVKIELEPRSGMLFLASILLAAFAMHD
jgi:hypothetical protein